MLVKNSYVFDSKQIKNLNLKNCFGKESDEEYYQMPYNSESFLVDISDDDDFFISEDEIIAYDISFDSSYIDQLEPINVTLDDNKKIVYKNEYEKKGVKELNFNNELEIIEKNAFKDNMIENINFNDNLKKIGNASFANNKIKNIIFNNELEEIEDFAFKNNLISELVLPQNLKKIGFEAFARNNIKHVILPDDIELISCRAFDRTVSFTYKNIFIDSYEAYKFGHNNLFKTAFIKSKVPNFDFKSIDIDEFDIIPMSVDGIKGFINNRKRFNKFKNELDITDEFDYDFDMDYYVPTQSIDFMKLCYILGYFNSNGNKLTEIENDIRKIYNEIGKTGIAKALNALNFNDYNKKLAEVVRKDLDSSLFLYTISNYYNRYDEINKGIIKKRENDVAKLNTARKKMIEKNMDTTEIDTTLKVMKKNIKNYNLNDVLDYITYNTFEIKEENKEMEKILPYLIGNVNVEGFEKLNRLLSAAKKVKDNKFYEFKGEANNLNYEWLNNADPINLILGYAVDCCAKLKGAGEDIMIQSMINPNFKNLVIYNNNEIIAKSTAFYNENYILCNNIEVSRSYLESGKTSYKELMNLCLTIIEALTIQAKKLNADEVRIGMLRNDLNSFINDLNMQIERRSMLKNYKFENYDGDANDMYYGQAIVYTK